MDDSSKNKKFKVTKVINISLNTDFNCTAIELLVTLRYITQKNKISC